MMKIKLIQVISAFSLLTLSPMCFANSLATESQKSQLQQFIPKNWEIISQANGDLNNDGMKDNVLIIQPKHQRNRKLIILFNQKSQLRSVLTKQIPNWSYSDTKNCINDALLSGGLSIQNNVLNIAFEEMNTCSNSYGIISTYRFQYHRSQFKLIGFEYDYLQKNNGEEKTISGNFQTGKMKITLQNISLNEIQPTVRWSRLKALPIHTLDKITLYQSDDFLKQMIQ